jgi:hypothetical protein
MNIGRYPEFFRYITENLRVNSANTVNRSLSRKCNDNAHVNGETKRIHDAIRKAADVADNVDTPSFPVLFFRSVIDTAMAISIISRIGSFIRGLVLTAGSVAETVRMVDNCRSITEQTKITMDINHSRSLSRKCTDDISANSQISKFQNFIRKSQDIVSGTDNQSFSVLFVRSTADTATVSQNNRHWGAFIRGLVFNAGSIAETSHKASYYRFQADTIQAAGIVFRGLFLFVRIVTGVFIRDYILSRFLKARTELVLKSCVVREIVLESRIN